MEAASKDHLMEEISLMREQIKSHLESLNNLENLVIVATGALWSFYASFSEKSSIIALLTSLVVLTILGVGFIRFNGLSANIYFIDHYTRGLEDIVFGKGHGWANVYRDHTFRQDVFKYIEENMSMFSVPPWIMKGTSVGKSRLLFWKSFFWVDVIIMLTALLTAPKFK